MQELPGFYHPTTLLLLDDDQAFLNSLQLALAPHYSSIAHTSAKAIEQIIRRYRLTHQPLDSQADLCEADRAIKTAALYPYAFQPNRFNQVLVLILDYDMPQINGLVVAQQLKSLGPIKIIMLTGEADQTTAVRAFNQGYIDRFITKGAKNYFEVLLTYIQELHYSYFLETTQRLLMPLNPKINPLKTPKFIQLFQRICQSHHIVEYYLVDESYSLLLIDEIGTITWLLVRTEEDMQMYYELAQEDGSDELLQSLQQRQQIACFPTLQSRTDSVENWHFYPATPLLRQKIYYCLLKDDEGYPLETHRIGCYADFLKQPSDKLKHMEYSD